MKIIRTLSLLGTGIALTSCGALENLQQPITDEGFNPLDRAGSFKRKSSDGLIKVGSSANSPGLATGHGFKSGDMVEVAIANTALFNRIPQPGDRYKRVLKVGDALKVVGIERDFLRVVTPKGETGYVSSVMVISQGAALGGAGIPPVGDIAPPPEIPSINGPAIEPVKPLPVPSITEPVPVEPLPVPSLPDPAPVPKLPDPEPLKPANPGGDPPPVPEIPGLPE